MTAERAGPPLRVTRQPRLAASVAVSRPGPRTVKPGHGVQIRVPSPPTCRAALATPLRLPEPRFPRGERGSTLPAAPARAPSGRCRRPSWCSSTCRTGVGAPRPVPTRPRPAAGKDAGPTTGCLRRAAAYSKLGNYAGAVQDCERAICIDPAYSKAYGRMG